jgi:hypothetical protein
MPLLVGLAATFAGFWAACSVPTLVIMVAVALFGNGPFEFNGAPVSRAEFLRRIPVVVLSLGALAVYFGAVAVAVWRERAWVRPAVLAFWLAVSALLVAQGISGTMSLVEALVWSAVYLGFVGWYFYAKPNVVAYYGALQAREREGPAPSGTDQRAV